MERTTLIDNMVVPSVDRLRRVVVCDPEAMFAEALVHLLAVRGFVSIERQSSLEAMQGRVAAHAGDPQVLCTFEIDDGAGPPGRPEQLSAMRVLADRSLLVVITRNRDARVRARALATGIRAFLTKDQPATTVLAALDRVCDPTATRAGVDPLLGFVAGPAPDPVAELFTPRERDVLQGLVDGESVTQLAGRLGVRPSTLRGYIQRVLTKLGVHSRAAAAAVAVQRGLARPGPTRQP